MKGSFSVLVTTLLLTLTPVFVGAQGFGLGGDAGVGGGTAGCSARGESCYGSAGAGICAQDPEYGTLYCRPNALNTTGGGQGSLNLNILKGYKTNIEFVINGIFVPLLFAIAFLVFVWGIFKYFIWGADSPDERKTGRDLALYGIIGFVIILSVWGLVLLVMNTLGLWGGSAGSYRLAPPSL